MAGKQKGASLRLRYTWSEEALVQHLWDESGCVRISVLEILSHVAPEGFETDLICDLLELISELEIAGSSRLEIARQVMQQVRPTPDFEVDVYCASSSDESVDEPSIPEVDALMLHVTRATVNRHSLSITESLRPDFSMKSSRSFVSSCDSAASSSALSPIQGQGWGEFSNYKYGLLRNFIVHSMPNRGQQDDVDLAQTLWMAAVSQIAATRAATYAPLPPVSVLMSSLSRLMAQTIAPPTTVAYYDLFHARNVSRLNDWYDLKTTALSAYLRGSGRSLGAQPEFESSRWDPSLDEAVQIDPNQLELWSD
jgi:hypothetical protein